MRSRGWILAAFTVIIAACGNPPPAHPASRPAPSATPIPGRPAPAMIQVENAPDARPHAGLQQADLVFEYLTEGGITRFTAVYTNPSGAGRIGPVRSARLVTLRLARAYGGVLLYSGASDRVQGLIWDQKLPAYDDRSDGGQYMARDSSRPAPHNLFTTGDQAALAVARSRARVTYDLPPRGEPAGQGDAQVTRLSFQQTFAHSVSYTYDPVAKAYTYRSETGPEIDTDSGGQPLQIAGVVLIRVAHHGAGYTEDVRGEEGIDFDLQGQGRADVYTRGQHFPATWDLSNPSQPLRILGSGGQDFTLPPGLTWIHLVDPDLPVSASA